MLQKFNFSKILAFVLAFSFSAVFANDEHATKADEKPFNMTEMIMHHISDEHEWHFATIGHTHVTLPLPCIVYQPGKGLQVFMSSNFKDEHHNTVSYNGLKLEHGKIHAEDGSHVYDFSITKNVAQLLISAVLLLLVFTTIAKSSKRNSGKAPSGIQSVFEPLIAYVRDDIARANIGEKYYLKFTPYLLTLFFFIWFNNMLGLLPGSANVTGNIAVTMVLAVIAFFITNLNGKSTYWGHIFWMPGVPVFMKFFLAPIELLGVFVKPVTLMVRLFANITAGHIILLSLLGIVFMFKSFAVGGTVSAFMVALNVLELLVAFLQALIFTLLTSMYIGSAVEEHHH
jgi:F-type H+-transporting ATPase subunit a